MAAEDAAAVTLSSREREILELSARGAVAVEVAGALGLPLDEVREHLAAATRKLGARSRLEAVIVALRDGLIELPAE